MNLAFLVANIQQDFPEVFSFQQWIICITRDVLDSVRKGGGGFQDFLK